MNQVLELQGQLAESTLIVERWAARAGELEEAVERVRQEHGLLQQVCFV